MDSISKENERLQIDIDNLHQIIEAIPANVFYKDTLGRYQLCSHVCKMLSGDSEDYTIIGKTDLEVQVDKELGKKFYEEDMQIIKTEQELKYTTKMTFGTEDFYYEISRKPVYDRNNKLIGLVGMVNDVTTSVKLRKELELLNITDMLTNTYNRRYYEMFLDSTITQEQLPVSFIMCDCNNLKYINDNFGHKKGDYLITKSVGLIKDNIPDNSDIIRMGGDEFLVICRNCSDDECKSLIKTLKEKEKQEHICNTTLSTAYGYHTINSTSESISNAINDADIKMYSDKQLYKLM